MRVFLTGGTGFIGSYVVNELVNDGHAVTILARNPRKVSGFLNQPMIRIVEGTLTDRDAISRGLDGAEACVHIALGWGDTAVDMLESDTLPSLFIFETAATMGVKNLIFTSSTAAYGEIRQRLGQDTKTRPSDFYGATKASTENYLLAISHKYGVRVNTIRPGYTFGNPAVEGGSIYSDKRFRQIVTNAKAGEPIRLVKHDGTQFIWAGDLAKIYKSVLTSHHNREFWNGLGAEFVTWEEIARMAVEYSGSNSEIVLTDDGRSRGECVYDVSLIESEFGYKFGCRDRLKDHVAYLAEHPNI